MLHFKRLDLRSFLYRMAWLGLAAYVWLATSPVAMAAKKKVEVVEPETKSYVVPYMIVLALVGVGLMSVLRPGQRLDKPGDKVKSSDD